MKIDHILSLARLKIKNKEKKELEKEFILILDFIKKLQELNTKDVKPMSYPTELKNIFREDKISLPSKDKQEAKRLLDSAPVRKNRYIKVKQILQ